MLASYDTGVYTYAREERQATFLSSFLDSECIGAAFYELLRYPSSLPFISLGFSAPGTGFLESLHLAQHSFNYASSITFTILGCFLVGDEEYMTQTHVRTPRRSRRSSGAQPPARTISPNDSPDLIFLFDSQGRYTRLSGRMTARGTGGRASDD